MPSDALIKVVISGALGRMGKEVVAAVCGDKQLDLEGQIKSGREYLSLPGGLGLID